MQRKYLTKPILHKYFSQVRSRRKVPQPYIKDIHRKPNVYLMVKNQLFPIKAETR